MGVSHKKTAMAVLRAIAGIRVQEMAQLLECSVATVQSLESGRVKLTEKMATKVIHRTGVDGKWLLDNNPSVAPRTIEGARYTRESFIAALGGKSQRRATAKEIALDLVAVRAILVNANKSGLYFIALYKLRRALSEIVEQYC